MSKLEKAIIAMEEVFMEYAGTDENKKCLSNAELSTLVKAQLGSPEFKDKIDAAEVAEAMAKIDKNKDGQVNFNEFSQCVSHLAQSYYKKKHGRGCKGGK